jgi:hypothetical protein
MRITEEQLRQIVREEILDKSSGRDDERDDFELDISQELGPESDLPAGPPVTPLPKGTPDREKINLKIWFGDSKIRNKDGSPKRMYHGTRAEFTAFRVAEGGRFGPGIYFTDDPKIAGNFAEQPGVYGLRADEGNANIVPVYLRVLKPFVIPDSVNSNSNLMNSIKASGYDGLVVKSPGSPFYIVVVHDPRQVKSSTGNVGDFDWRDSDVTSESSRDFKGGRARITEGQLRQIVREEILEEDVRRRGDQWCAYVDDKLTKAEKEANPSRHKGKKVGAVQRTRSGKIRMKARACYASRKKANNAMAAAMMEQVLREIEEIESELEERRKSPPPGYLWKNIRKRRAAGKRPRRPGEKGYPKTLDFD